MSDTPTRDAKLVEYLNDAYAQEKQLEATLAAHAEVATHDAYAARLKDHLKETKAHATKLSRRIKQLGGEPGSVATAGPDGLGRFAGNVSETLGKAKSAAEDKLHAVRRLGDQERMLRNARAEYADEARRSPTTP